MDTASIIREITGALQDLSMPERQALSEHYFPTSQKVIGVTAPDMKVLLSALKKKYNALTLREWIILSAALVDTGIFECQMLAYERIGRDRKLLDAMTPGDVSVLWKNLDNWASVDSFSVGIHGVLWRKGVVSDQRIGELLRSDNAWDKRVAVVSTVALNLKSRGGTGDTARTLSVCERVVDERHDMIWKALSWALRELSKKDPEAAYAFIEEHEDRISKRVLREVRHKLEYGTKN